MLRLVLRATATHIVLVIIIQASSVKSILLRDLKNATSPTVAVNERSRFQPKDNVFLVPKTFDSSGIDRDNPQKSFRELHSMGSVSVSTNHLVHYTKRGLPPLSPPLKLFATSINDDAMVLVALCDLALNTNLGTLFPNSWGSCLNGIQLSITVVCDWEGVLCQFNNVVYINLYGLGLFGRLASSIGHLSSLQSLLLSYNSLSSSIPSSIGLLSSLQNLYLTYNKLSSMIPSSIGLLSSLQNLCLTYNKLSSSIPSSIGLLSSLQNLYLTNNELSSSIPSSIGLLSSLQSLWLSLNKLSSSIPSSIGLLSSLQNLYLSYNKLSSVIPSSIGLLSSLQNLYVSYNELSSSIPSTIGLLSSLQNLYVTYNKLSSVIPSSIGLLSSLQSLYLTHNQLSSSIPSSIGLLSSLQDLSLSQNKLSSSMPSSIGQLSSLQYLHSSFNKLSSSIPSSIGLLSSMLYVSFRFNKLSNTIPSTIGQLSLVQTLYFYSNHLSAVIPSSIGQLSSLQALCLSRNLLSSSIPSSIGQLSSLHHLSLSYNQLSSVIPSSLGQLSSLHTLYLSNNKLSSTIPSWLTKLSLLYGLSLCRNKLSSSIPSSIYQMSLLQTLDLSGNHLSSTISSEIGLLSSLKFLDLSGSHLSSAIPLEIGLLSSLDHLVLSGNLFTSSIPSSIGQLSSLQYLHLSSNKLSSSIPSTFGLLSSLQSLDVSGNCLTTIPASLSNMPALVYLSLSHNNLQGTLPDTIFEMPSMQCLDLSHNSFMGSIPDSLMHLSRTIKVINLGFNILTNSVPIGICDVTSLLALVTVSNKFDCAAPCESNFPTASVRCPDRQDGALSDLNKALLVYRNLARATSSSTTILESSHPFQAEDTVTHVNETYAIGYTIVISPSSDLCCSVLRICNDIDCSFVYGSYVGVFGETFPYNVNDEIISLPSNSLTINVPNSAFFITITANPSYNSKNCAFAVGYKLYISTTYLYPIGWTFKNHSGSVTATGLCTSVWAGITCNGGIVTAIDLASTSLGGTIPESIGKLTGLSRLDFSGNHITGNLPSSLSGLSNLVTLKLCSNLFRGNIPPDLVTLTTLKVIDLSFNSFSGSVPSFFAVMSSLTTLNLNANLFAGEVPSELCILRTIISLIQSPLLTCYQESCWKSVPEATRGLIFDTTCSMCAPTASPSIRPTLLPTASPTFTPSSIPSYLPSLEPTHVPTLRPTLKPSPSPTLVPSFYPTQIPIHSPSGHPTGIPTGQPSNQPSTLPTAHPSPHPTKLPTINPTTAVPTTASPTVSPSTTPSTKPSKAVVVTVPLLSSQQIVVVSTVCSLVLFVFFCALIYRQCFSEKAVEKRRKRMRLRELPVHRALLESEPISGPRLLALMDEHKSTLSQNDFDGQTVLDIILNRKINTLVPPEVVYSLLCECLPSDRFCWGHSDAWMRSKGWTNCIQSDEDVAVAAVDLVLSAFKDKVYLLANCLDASGRRAVDIAGPNCKKQLLKRLYLFERFEVHEGPPEHCSATSVVVLAYDHNERLNGTTGVDDAGVRAKLVALKFMRNIDQFLKEVEMRGCDRFDDKYVVPLLMKFWDPAEGCGATFNAVSADASEANVDFRNDAILKGYEEYHYCIVMEAGSQSLKRLIDHERIAGNNWDEIKNIARSLAGALQHIHSKGVVHGDHKPLNVLLVGTTIKLIDLDASANFANNEYVGSKYSSGYIPPEMLTMDDEGVVQVRHGNDMILADPSQDMWALGCILYYLLSAKSLFHVNTDDNLGAAEDYEVLLDWDIDVKVKKLAAIPDRLGKNLVSLLLNKDPKRRPDASHVLMHPYFTGQKVSRLQGDEAEWDVFLSYRVASDSVHAEAFYRQLTGLGLKVWWDKVSLLPGQNWEEGFCSGLLRSANFACLISRGAIRDPNNDRSNFEKLTVMSPCDNVLLEWRLALEAKERGMIEGVFPIMIDGKEPDNKYSNYFASGCKPTAPRTHVDSVEKKLREHLEREGLGLPLTETETVASILDTILSNQGGFVEGKLMDAVVVVSRSIEAMVKLVRSPGALRHGTGFGLTLTPVRSARMQRTTTGLSAQSDPDSLRLQLEQELELSRKEASELRRQVAQSNDEKLRIENENATLRQQIESFKVHTVVNTDGKEVEWDAKRVHDCDIESALPKVDIFSL